MFCVKSCEHFVNMSCMWYKDINMSYMWYKDMIILSINGIHLHFFFINWNKLVVSGRHIYVYFILGKQQSAICVLVWCNFFNIWIAYRAHCNCISSSLQASLKIILFNLCKWFFLLKWKNLTIILRVSMVHFLVQTEKVELERTVVHETKERETLGYANRRQSG